MHGRFGKNLVAQMLCGSKNKKLQQWKLHRLSTYGLLSGLKQTEVVAVMDALVQAGLLQQKEVDERRPTIHMTDLGRQVMLEQIPLPDAVTMPMPLAKRLALATRELEPQDVQTKSPGSGDGDTSDQGEAASPRVIELAERLKRWRRKTSAALGIPAYRVLTNATIDRIAETQPATTEQLESVSGVGSATIEQFGYDIVELILASIDGPETQTESERQAEPQTPAEPAAEPRSPAESEPQTESEQQSDPATASADHPAITPGTPAVTEDPTVAPTIDHSGSAPETGSSCGPGSELPRPDTNRDAADAYWTWRLFRDGYSAHQIASIRRCDLARLENDLIVSAAAGHVVRPEWVTGAEAAKRIRDAVAATTIGG
jgi:ATP-dependent DNA helicase RecQ